MPFPPIGPDPTPNANEPLPAPPCPCCNQGSLPHELFVDGTRSELQTRWATGAWTPINVAIHEVRPGDCFWVGSDVSSFSQSLTRVQTNFEFFCAYSQPNGIMRPQPHWWLTISIQIGKQTFGIFTAEGIRWSVEAGWTTLDGGWANDNCGDPAWQKPFGFAVIHLRGSPDLLAGVARQVQFRQLRVKRFSGQSPPPPGQQ
jgi:hypothetical protein